MRCPRQGGTLPSRLRLFLRLFSWCGRQRLARAGGARLGLFSWLADVNRREPRRPGAPSASAAIPLDRRHHRLRALGVQAMHRGQLQCDLGHAILRIERTCSLCSASWFHCRCGRFAHVPSLRRYRYFRAALSGLGSGAERKRPAERNSAQRPLAEELGLKRLPDRTLLLFSGRWAARASGAIWEIRAFHGVLLESVADELHELCGRREGNGSRMKKGHREVALSDYSLVDDGVGAEVWFFCFINFVKRLTSTFRR